MSHSIITISGAEIRVIDLEYDITKLTQYIPECQRESELEAAHSRG
jgi:hypothetical protein